MAFLKPDTSKKVDMKIGGTIMEILKTVLLFIQDQILGMEWLGEMIGSLQAWTLTQDLEGAFSSFSTM